MDDNNDMDNGKTKWMWVEAADISIGCSFLAFGLSALLLGSDLVATLLDGKLFPMRLLFDASFSVWGLFLRYFGKKYKNKTA